MAHYHLYDRRHSYPPLYANSSTVVPKNRNGDTKPLPKALDVTPNKALSEMSDSTPLKALTEVSYTVTTTTRNALPESSDPTPPKRKPVDGVFPLTARNLLFHSTCLFPDTEIDREIKVAQFVEEQCEIVEMERIQRELDIKRKPSVIFVLFGVTGHKDKKSKKWTKKIVRYFTKRMKKSQKI